MTSTKSPRVFIYCEEKEAESDALLLSKRLSLPIIRSLEGEGYFILCVDSPFLSLRFVEDGAPGALLVDFTAGALDFRRRYGGSGGQMVLNAIGGARKIVLDTTAGLCRDAFILASHECSIHALEKSPVVWALVDNALKRALQNEKTSTICQRIHFEERDAKDYLATTKTFYDAIYLDPMFPEKNKKALPKKELRLLQMLLGSDDHEIHDEDARQIFILARSHTSRIVVKRPLRAEPLIEKPTVVFKGTSTRFDVYISN